MITADKLKIYSRYKGDIDMWTRTGKRKEKKIMTTNDWYLIERLLQDLTIARKGLASEEFKIDLDKKLVENCDGVDTINRLKKEEEPNFS